MLERKRARHASLIISDSLGRSLSLSLSADGERKREPRNDLVIVVLLFTPVVLLFCFVLVLREDLSFVQY